MREVCVVSSVIQSSVVCAWFAQQVPQVLCSAVLKASARAATVAASPLPYRHGNAMCVSATPYRRFDEDDEEDTKQRCGLSFDLVFYSFHTHWLTFCDRYSWD